LFCFLTPHFVKIAVRMSPLVQKVNYSNYLIASFCLMMQLIKNNSFRNSNFPYITRRKYISLSHIHLSQATEDELRDTNKNAGDVRVADVVRRGRIGANPGLVRHAGQEPLPRVRGAVPRAGGQRSRGHLRQPRRPAVAVQGQSGGVDFQPRRRRMGSVLSKVVSPERNPFSESLALWQVAPEVCRNELMAPGVQKLIQAGKNRTVSTFFFFFLIISII